jgi:uncharacterized sporulation protein YeaH/YhbH (DUF444 family)
MRGNHIRWRDEADYVERVKDALKKKLPEIIKSEPILSAPPGSRYPVRLPYLDVPHFRPPVGGEGGSGGGSGSGPGGQGEGEPHLVVEVPLEELLDMIFQELRLPLLPKSTDSPTSVPAVEGITHKAPRSRLHIRRTAKELVKRGGVLHEGALRYRDLREREEPRFAAVCVFVRDSSGSMDEERRMKAKVAALWVLTWLRRVYPEVAHRFVIHDTRAQEVEEKAFFEAELGGGTLVSKGWAMAEKILEDYPKERWNRYVVYYGDGENWPEDNPALEEVLARLVPTLEAAAYGEIGSRHGSIWGGGLLGLMRRHGVRAAHLDDVGEWLRKVFGEGE